MPVREITSGEWPMAKKENEEEKVIVCMPADRRPGTGARIQFCQRCLRKVWVSPESLIAAGADATIICVGCVQDHIDDSSGRGCLGSR